MDTDREVTTTEGDTGLEPEEQKTQGRGCGCWIVLALVILAGMGAGGFIGAQTLFRTEKPLPLEREVADLGKRWLMVPGEYVDRRIPERPGVSADTGRDLYLNGDARRAGAGAISCALCHGEAGFGDATLGGNMYPPAANLHAKSVQSKTDGQLFWLIAHGINLSGMPAYGDAFGDVSKGPYTEDEIWSLVSYIRTLKDAP